MRHGEPWQVWPGSDECRGYYFLAAGSIGLGGSGMAAAPCAGMSDLIGAGLVVNDQGADVGSKNQSIRV